LIGLSANCTPAVATLAMSSIVPLRMTRLKATGGAPTQL
jgi:hypothetical protein